jgi:predicted DNA-binding transcriptional regulator AlpA
MTVKMLSADQLFETRAQPGLIPFTRQHAERLERRGQFPQRYQLGAGRVAWAEVDILRWLEERPRGPAQFRGKRRGDDADPPAV